MQLGTSLIDQFGDHRILSDLQQTALHIGRITDELQEQVMKSRMLPVESVFNRLPRVVRDIAAKQGKQIEFIIEGKDTEVDRSVIEEIGDPLMHLIRNAADHGIEKPAERLASGKPGAGYLRLTASHTDSFIVIALDLRLGRLARQHATVLAECQQRLQRADRGPGAIFERDGETQRLLVSRGRQAAQRRSTARSKSNRARARARRSPSACRSPWRSYRRCWCG
ncbi:MAG: hypothetical protein E6I75_00990 [Chloroflexi bacterium]|nr:MAG: hypothetical protein E6I75_00990 [Chloroflexota bacterium]